MQWLQRVHPSSRLRLGTESLPPRLGEHGWQVDLQGTDKQKFPKMSQGQSQEVSAQERLSASFCFPILLYFLMINDNDSDGDVDDIDDDGHCDSYFSPYKAPA